MTLRRWQVGGAALIAALAAATVSATMRARGSPTPFAGKHVDNFMLEDQHGIGRELYYYKHNPAVVIVTTATGDAPSAQAIAAINAMRAGYEKQGVMFFALASDAKAATLPGKLEADGSLPVLAFRFDAGFPIPLPKQRMHHCYSAPDLISYGLSVSELPYSF